LPHFCHTLKRFFNQSVAVKNQFKIKNLQAFCLKIKHKLPHFALFFPSRYSTILFSFLKNKNKNRK
jgi:hypothetical protein